MAMSVCAYSSHLHPTYHPNWSYLGLIYPVFLGLNMGFLFFWLLFKRKFVLIPLAGMLLCASSVRTYFPINFKQDVPEGAIKLLSYNVMGYGENINSDSILNANPIVNYIMDTDADIVCIQEGSILNNKRMEAKFGEKYPYIQEGTENEHINVCLSKYPILDYQIINFRSETNRCFAYKILIDQDTVLVVNNHFESYSLNKEDKQEYKDIIEHPRAKDNVLKYDSLTTKLISANSLRGLQADRVAEYIDSVPCKYKIACGDFNDPSISYTHYRMTRHLNDAFTRAGCGAGISYNQSGMLFRIDNILMSPNITAYQTKVDNSIRKSDHYPIVSYLFLKEK